MSEQRAVDFLRRRYANAILRDDMDTACRLRQQLDRIMNRARLAQSRCAAAPDPRADAPPPAVGSSGQRALRIAPRMSVTTPVTGLLEPRRMRSPLASIVPL